MERKREVAEVGAALDRQGLQERLKKLRVSLGALPEYAPDVFPVEAAKVGVRRREIREEMASIKAKLEDKEGR